MFSIDKLPLRSKLLLALAVPLVALGVFAFFQIISSLQSSNESSKQLDEVNQAVLLTQLANTIKTERDVSITFDAQTSDLEDARTQTNAALAYTQDPANGVSQNARTEIAALEEKIQTARPALGESPNRIAQTINQQLSTEGSSIRDENSAMWAVLEMNDATNTSIGLIQINNEVLVEAETAQNINELQLSASLDSIASFEGLNYLILTQLDPASINREITNLQIANRTEAEATLKHLADSGQTSTRSTLNDLTNKQIWNEYVVIRDGVAAVEPNGAPLVFNTAEVNKPIQEITTTLEKVQNDALNDLNNSATSSKDTASRTAWLTFFISIGLFLLIGYIVFRLYASIRKPIIKLTERSRKISEVELPDAVARMRQSRADAKPPTITPIKAETDDEIGELVEAFNGMHTTAIDLASEQAAARRTVGDMFINLGRRNQKLLLRALNELDQLELEEKDPDRLAALYRVDQLATRMRRNAESLIVLAGAKAARHISQTVTLGDIARSAAGEVENFDRVDIHITEDATIDGSAAVDLTHLFAELIENAVQFSPQSSRTTVTINKKNTDYRVTIADEGLGMSTDKLAESNLLIQEAAQKDETPSKHLGLYVVGRLAARHNLAINLKTNQNDGLTATINIPENVVIPETEDPEKEDGSNAPSPLERPAEQHAPAAQEIPEPPQETNLVEPLAVPPVQPPAIKKPQKIEKSKVQAPLPEETTEIPLPVTGISSSVKRNPGANFPSGIQEEPAETPARRAEDHTENKKSATQVGSMLGSLQKGIAGEKPAPQSIRTTAETTIDSPPDKKKNPFSVKRRKGENLPEGIPQTPQAEQGEQQEPAQTSRPRAVASSLGSLQKGIKKAKQETTENPEDSTEKWNQ